MNKSLRLSLRESNVLLLASETREPLSYRFLLTHSWSSSLKSLSFTLTSLPSSFLSKTVVSVASTISATTDLPLRLVHFRGLDLLEGVARAAKSPIAVKLVPLVLPKTPTTGIPFVSMVAVAPNSIPTERVDCCVERTTFPSDPICALISWIAFT